MKFNKILLAIIVLGFLGGCSSHGPEPAYINDLCMTEAESGSCMGQEAICKSYNSALQKTYSSATECRRACDSVENQFSGNMNAQGCNNLFDEISGLCSEYCDKKYN